MLYTIMVACRNPLWSGHSFRQLRPGTIFTPADGRNPLWSGHSFRPTTNEVSIMKKAMSQSPLVGAFVPAQKVKRDIMLQKLSQSPLVGAFVPAQISLLPTKRQQRSQSPLVGAFVPAF